MFVCYVQILHHVSRIAFTGSTKRFKTDVNVDVSDTKRLRVVVEVVDHVEGWRDSVVAYGLSLHQICSSIDLEVHF